MNWSKTLLTAGVVGAGILPCGLAALVSIAISKPAVHQNQTVGAWDIPRTETPHLDAMNEVSLQETLDGLGYTVNVPVVYGGHQLLRWNNYRLSTGDDALPATTFVIGNSARFTKVSEQGMLAGSTDFGVMDAQGKYQMVLPPDHNQNTYWISQESEDACTWSPTKSTRFYINDTSQMLHTGVFSSAPQVNADHTPHLLALPARIGGHWVEEGSNTGHWEGGKDTGATLLCWEDWQDYDYQDMVIRADNVVLEKTGAEAQGKNEIVAVRPQVGLPAHVGQPGIPI